MKRKGGAAGRWGITNMNKEIFTKYRIDDPAQDKDDHEFWKAQSHEYKINVLEVLRKMWQKLNPVKGNNGDFERLRRVFRITKQA